MMNFKIEKVANMIYISSDDVIWKAWNVADFTERKLENAKKKIQSCHIQPINWNKTF